MRLPLITDVKINLIIQLQRLNTWHSSFLINQNKTPVYGVMEEMRRTLQEVVHGTTKKPQNYSVYRYKLYAIYDSFHILSNL